VTQRLPRTQATVASLTDHDGHAFDAARTQRQRKVSVLSEELSQSQVTRIPETQLSAPVRQDGKHFGSAIRHESKSRSFPSPHGHVSMFTLTAYISATETDETQPNDYSSGDPDARPAAAEKKRSVTGKRAAAADKPATEYVFECKLLLHKATLLMCHIFMKLSRRATWMLKSVTRFFSSLQCAY
jgi:hypothetical protein